MSVNQSRAEKTDPHQHRKTGRSANSGSQRNYSGGGGKGGGGGGGTAPPPSYFNNPHLSSNKSFKKSVNAQGAQSRNASLDSSNSAAVAASAASTSATSASARGIQNGARSQLPSHGGSDAPFSVNANTTSTQKRSLGLPKAPAQNISTVNSSGMAPSDPEKGSGGFPLQFGSISAGLMQIPARTSSAPPYLDEQKREQARYDSLRAVPVLPTQSIPLQYTPTKNSIVVDQSNAVEANPMSRARRDIQVSAGPHTTQMQKPSVHPIPGMPMQMPFHQPHIPVQFGGPNPQLQSQGMINSSIPMAMAMPLPMGNPSQVQQQVYVQGLQPHMMHSQGVVHHGPSINFSSQMGGNMGINIPPQFSQQRPGNFGGARRTVKITHPETHEELSLNKKVDTYTEAGSSAPRLHPNMPSHSQPISSFPPGHPVNYYPNSYSQGSVFFTSPNSLPLTSTQITSGSPAPRVYNQVTVKPAANSRGEKIAISSLPVSSPALEKTSPNITVQHGEATSLHTQSDPENITEKSLQQSKSTLIPVPSEPTIGVSDSVSVASPVTNCFTSTSAFTENPTSVSSSTSVGTRSDMLNRSNSNKYDEKKPGKKSNSLMQNQLGRQSMSGSTLSAEIAENTKSIPLLETAELIQEAPRGLDKTVVVPADPEFKPDGTKIQGTRELAKIDGADTSEISAHLSLLNEKPKHEDVGDQERGDRFPDESKEGATGYATNPECTSLKPENVDKTESQGLELKEKHQKLEKEPVLHGEGEADGDVSTSTYAAMGNLIAETSSLCLDATISVNSDKTSATDSSTSNTDAVGSTEGSNTDSGMLDQKSSILSIPACEIEVTDGDSTELISTSTDSKDKSAVETNIPNITIASAKQKKKEALQKADRAGTMSDLYMAYRGPEEKKENFANVESSDTISSHSKEVSAGTSRKDTPNESKAEPDDWEDVADLSTPKLETSDDRKQVAGIKDIEDGNSLARKYSRDFLLKFSEQCKDLPHGFEITSDVAEAMIMATGNIPREVLPSPGRILDRSMGGSRSGRRGSGMGDDDKWSKQPGPLPSPRDLRLDIGYGNYGNNVFQSGQGGNFGVLRNPRAQSPVLYPGGILSGPMHSMGPHAGMQRINFDSDRWQRATGYHRGLIPSPQTPLQVMHKADRKYEVGKITDEEQAKQRQLKGILNKLTPQNFEKLFEQVKQVNIDNAGTLTGVISQIFDKALTEPTFCEMYANFCYHLAGELPDFSEDNEKITFKRLLLNKCQEEFERGEREQEEANRAEEEGDAKLSDEEREAKRVQARRRMLGNIRLIGELYKKKMLTERIMHECIQKLLGQYQNPDEEDVEALCKLMSTIGVMIDHPKAKEYMDSYFDAMAKLSNSMKLSSRVRFMLKDSIDLRKNKWQQRRKIEGPKKIDEVHRDAANERQAQANRLARGPSISYRRGQQPMDFSPRGSNVLLSSNSQMGGFRGMPQQPRGYAMQDVRTDDRHAFENRTLSVPLPQRPLGGETITLGPQGGLARGMSIRGQPPMSNIPFSDMQSPDSRTITGLNGYGSVSDRPAYASREELVPRFAPDRFAGPAAHDQINSMDGKFRYGSREERNPDLFSRSRPTTPPTRSKELSSVENLPSEKVRSEEQLRKMSMETIKEFYSAKDEKEVTLCVKGLNSPSFYSSMISIWVSDSFERKDMERDLLAKLLVNLTKSQDALLSQAQLVEGFESVLASLEDAVNDAPRAAEFLGSIFAKLILENVLPMTEIGRLIYEGGEEKGRLVEVGLAAELLGSILEIIRSDKGDTFLNEICAGSNLRVENFRPPNSKKPLRLDKYI